MSGPTCGKKKKSVKLFPSLFSAFCPVLFISFLPLWSAYSFVRPFLLSVPTHICVTLVMGHDCTAQHVNIR